MITAAGFWTCVLIVWRIFDKQGTSGHGPVRHHARGSSGASSSRSPWRCSSPTRARGSGPPTSPSRRFPARSTGRRVRQFRGGQRREPGAGEVMPPGARCDRRGRWRLIAHRRRLPPIALRRRKRVGWPAGTRRRDDRHAHGPVSPPRGAEELFERVAPRIPTMRFGRMPPSRRPARPSSEPHPDDDQATIAIRDDATGTFGRRKTRPLGADDTLVLGADALAPRRGRHPPTPRRPEPVGDRRAAPARRRPEPSTIVNCFSTWSPVERKPSRPASLNTRSFSWSRLNAAGPRWNG